MGDPIFAVRPCAETRLVRYIADVAYPQTEFDRTHRAPLRRRQPLPIVYYHRHLTKPFEVVERRCAHAFLEGDVR